MAIRTVLVSLGSLCLAATPALAASTVQQKFEKKLARYAQPLADLDFTKPRGLCSCGADDPLGQPSQTGLLVYYFDLGVGTAIPHVLGHVPVFDDTGALAETYACVDWTLLSR